MSVTDAHAGHDFAGVRWIGAADATALRRSAYQRIVGAAARAIERRGRFLIVLAGGNTPRGVYELLRAASTDWSCWQVYFGDERCLPPDNAGRNSRMAVGIWLEHAPIANEDQDRTVTLGHTPRRSHPQKQNPAGSGVCVSMFEVTLSCDGSNQVRPPRGRAAKVFELAPDRA